VGDPFGFDDAGRLAPGDRADFNSIDLAFLHLHASVVVYELPAGGKRLA
jgi:N-acyl-D-aspartate/D-glutamate deacylase